MSTLLPDPRQLAAALVLALLAGSVGACTADDRPPAAGTTHRHHGRATSPGLTPSRLHAPADVLGGLRAVLDARAKALLVHDREAFDQGIGGSAAFHARQATYFSDLAQLPIAELTFELAPASLLRTDDGYWADVEVSMRLDGFDAHPVVTPDRYRFVRKGHGFALASVTDPQWESEHHVASQPWDDQALTVRRRSGVLGLFDRASADQARPLMRAVARGVAQVRPLVPSDWDGSVVVYALADPSFLQSLPDVPGGDAMALDAITFPVFAHPGSQRVASMRVVLNPRLLTEPGMARDRLIRHELTHVAMGMRDDTLPVWLSEGLAEHVSVQPIPPRDRVLSGAAIDAARRGLTHLPDGDTFNGPAAAANYGIAWWACEAVVDNYGEQTLWSLARDLAGAPDPDAELKVLLGISARALARKAGRLILATYDPEDQKDSTHHKDH